MRYIYIIFALFAMLLLGNSKSFAQSGQELVDICGMIAGDATYLKDFQIKLEAAKPGEELPTARYSVVLSKNTEYLFSICNSKDYPGEAILHLYDNNRLVTTNYIIATGKYYPKVSFKCSTTGVYHMFITFKEGDQGLAVALLSFVQRL
ncbi:MAG TPA: hypothetical protein DCG75_19090 [Bacteroidales bacterium]|nr:hypothetical protein [Bacteroidales bacterium]